MNIQEDVSFEQNQYEAMVSPRQRLLDQLADLTATCEQFEATIEKVERMWRVMDWLVYGTLAATLLFTIFMVVRGALAV